VCWRERAVFGGPRVGTDATLPADLRRLCDGREAGQPTRTDRRATTLGRQNPRAGREQHALRANRSSIAQTDRSFLVVSGQIAVSANAPRWRRTRPWPRAGSAAPDGPSPLGAARSQHGLHLAESDTVPNRIGEESLYSVKAARCARREPGLGAGAPSSAGQHDLAMGKTDIVNPQTTVVLCAASLRSPLRASRALRVTP
jgi:hypothetical protein